MPPDRSDLATPTLMRAARGPMPAPSGPICRRSASTTCPGTVPSSSSASIRAAAPGGPAGRPRREQAGREPGRRRPGAAGATFDRAPTRPTGAGSPSELTERGHQVVAAVWRGTEAIDRAAGDAGLARGDRQPCGPGLMALADIKAETTASAPAPRPARAPPSSVSSARSSPCATWPPRWPTTPRLVSRPSPTRAASDYGFANRDGLSLHLALDPAHEPGVDLPLRARRRRPLRGMEPAGLGGLTRPVGLMPYGLREGSHIDPDGNEIRFGSADEVEQ